MKTIIVKGSEKTLEIKNFVARLEKYTDKHIKDAVICTRYLDTDNYNTIIGEMKDAVSLNDYDLFIVASISPFLDVTALQSINRAHTLVCTADDIDSAKNFIIMI